MKFVKLGEVAQVFCGGSLDRSDSSCWDGSIPWVTAKDICGKCIMHDSLERVTEFGLRESASRLLPVGSLLVPASLNLGHVVMVDVPVAFNEDLMAIIVDSPVIDRRYLQQFLFFKAGDFEFCSRERIENGCATGILRGMDIPIFPIEEQRRIALMLDKVATICQKIHFMVKLADRFLHSVFFDMFGDPVTNPKGWPTCLLKDIAEWLPMGQTVTRLQDKAPVIAEEMILYYSTVFLKERQGHEQSVLFPFCAGKVVCEGRGREMGECGVVTTGGEDHLAGPGNLFIRPNPLVIEAAYLAQALSGDAMKTALERVSQSAWMQNLNETVIGNFCVPTPPLGVQKRYSQIHKKVILIRKNLKKELVQSNLLFKSLAAPVFAMAGAA